MAFFNSSKYGSGVKVAPSHLDGSDAFANHKQTVISFQHVPTGKSVYFKAFITAFNENYSSDWASEVVYGRADPIYMFKQTTRKITLAFKIPAATQGEAYENLGKVQAITQFLYPTYANVQEAQTISQSPLVRLKVMNLGRKLNEGKAESGEDRWDPVVAYENYTSDVDAGTGLLGTISNMAVNHNLEGEDGVIDRGQNIILPKLLDINLDFNVIHEHALGWDKENKFSEKAFPYGVRLSEIDVYPASSIAPTPLQTDLELASGADPTDPPPDAVVADEQADVINVVTTTSTRRATSEDLNWLQQVRYDAMASRVENAD